MVFNKSNLAVLASLPPRWILLACTKIRRYPGQANRRWVPEIAMVDPVLGSGQGQGYNGRGCNKTQEPVS